METGTFRAPGFASAPLPTVEVPWAQTYTYNQSLILNAQKVHRKREEKLTGSPQPVISAKSLILPLTTVPATPIYLIRTAMIPPRTAQFCPAGWSMTAIVPGSAQSTQCVPDGKPCLSSGVVSDSGSAEEDLGMNLKVEAGAIILGWVSLRPMVGEKGTFCSLALVVCIGLYRCWDMGAGRIPKSER